MAGIETGATTVQLAWCVENNMMGRLPHTGAEHVANRLRALAAERDTLAEQLNAALADAVTLAHRLTSAEGALHGLDAALSALWPGGPQLPSSIAYINGVDEAWAAARAALAATAQGGDGRG